MEKLRFALKLRRDKVIELFNSHMPNEVQWIEPTGGLNIWYLFHHSGTRTIY